MSSASDWAGARGEKWSAHASGLEATLAPVDDPLIAGLELETPVRIADIGCGGGRTTIEILRRAPRGTIVDGFDISPSLVAQARTRAEHIRFEVADMATALPPAPYDRLASRFGVMFFDDPDAAFANVARWLAPRGRFAFAVWGPPSENAWMTSVREVVARITDIPEPEPDAPGPFRYANAEPLLALLARAGLDDLTVRDWRGTLPIGGGLPPAEAAQFTLSAFSSFGDALAKAGEGAIEEARRSLTARMSDHRQDGRVRMDASVHIVTGARS